MVTHIPTPLRGARTPLLATPTGYHPPVMSHPPPPPPPPHGLYGNPQPHSRPWSDSGTLLHTNWCTVQALVQSILCTALYAMSDAPLRKTCNIPLHHALISRLFSVLGGFGYM